MVSLSTAFPFLLLPNNYYGIMDKIDGKKKLYYNRIRSYHSQSI